MLLYQFSNFRWYFQDLDNPALRLKPTVIEAISGRTTLPASFQWTHVEASNQQSWQYFNEKIYIDRTRLKPGQDAYARNKFNQQASDRIKSNRDIPDTRHPR